MYISIAMKHLVIYSNKKICSISFLSISKLIPSKFIFPWQLVSFWWNNWVKSHWIIRENWILKHLHHTSSKAQAFNTLTTFKASIKGKMSFLGLSTVSSWKHHIFAHIPSDGIIISHIITYFLKKCVYVNQKSILFINRTPVRFLSLIFPLPYSFVVIQAIRN